MRKRDLLISTPVLLLLFACGAGVPSCAARDRALAKSPGAGVRNADPGRPPADFLLDATFSKTEFYVGEAVTLTITYYRAKDVRSALLDIPAPKGGGFVFSDSAGWCRAPAQCSAILLGRHMVMAEKSAENIHGKEYTALSFQKNLVVRRPGTFEFPGASLTLRVASYEKPKGNLNPSDPAFLDELYTPGIEVVRNITVKSRPEKLVVKPLPEQGRPPGFSGAVGKFGLSASLSSPKVAPGTPLTLTMVVCGSGRPQDIPPPVLAKDPGLLHRYEVPKQMAPGRPGNGCKIFTQSLWPKFQGKGVVPAINYYYFDPDEGRYRTASSAPIPVEVTPAAANAEGLLYQTSLFGRDTMRYVIAKNYEKADFIGDRDTLSGALGPSAWIFFIAFPPALFLLFFFWRRLARKSVENLAAIRSAKAYSIFCQQVGRKSFPGSGQDRYLRLTLLMKSFLADKLNVPADNLTSADFMQMLQKKGVDEWLIVRLRSVFEACERYRFGGGAEPEGGIHKLVHVALEVFSGFDRHIG